MKILFTIIPTNLIRNSLLSHFCLNQKRIKFSLGWWSGNEKYFCFCLYRVALYFKCMLNSAMMMMMNCFCGMADRRKAFSLISSRNHSLSEILTIANLQHAAIRVCACAEPEFRLSWMKLCSSDDHYTTAPRIDYYKMM